MGPYQSRVFKRRRRKLSPKVASILRIVLLALLVALTLDTAFLFAVAFLPFPVLIRFLGIPTEFVALLDVSMIVSVAVVEVPIGIVLAVFLNRVLGEGKRGMIQEVDAVIKYSDLKFYFS